MPTSILETFPTKAALPHLRILWAGGKIPICISQTFYLPCLTSRAGNCGRSRLQVLRDQKSLSTIPTIAEFGLPGYEEYNWYGILAPKGTPESIIDKLHDEVVKALSDETLAKSLDHQGAEIIGDLPAQFAEYIRKEAQKYAEVVRRADISVKN